MRIAVTGAAGSVGTALLPRLKDHDVFASDVDTAGVKGVTTLDVTDGPKVKVAFAEFRPEVIYHLAADKHAPDGELDPGETARINIGGTENVLATAGDAKVIVASTCKAADPETAYGASKLIAERMVLNQSGVVIRFYNVRETQGNVFRLWETLPRDEPVPFTDCRRYFITINEAVDLAVLALELPTGRYTVPVKDPVRMEVEAQRLYPGRSRTLIPRRRGDRETEPMCARSETVYGYAGLWRIVSPHDPGETA